MYFELSNQVEYRIVSPAEYNANQWCMGREAHYGEQFVTGDKSPRIKGLEAYGGSVITHSMDMFRSRGRHPQTSFEYYKYCICITVDSIIGIML